MKSAKFRSKVNSFSNLKFKSKLQICNLQIQPEFYKAKWNLQLQPACQKEVQTSSTLLNHQIVSMHPISSASKIKVFFRKIFKPRINWNCCALHILIWWVNSFKTVLTNMWLNVLHVLNYAIMMNICLHEILLCM